MNNCLVVCNSIYDHHSDRLILGLQSSGCEVDVYSDFSQKVLGTYDYIFVDYNLPLDCRYLKDHYNKGILLYNVLDNPERFQPGDSYESLKDIATHCVKYNYRDSFPNPDGLIHIGCPLTYFISHGAHLAKQYMQLPTVPETGDVFFIGSPSYLANYTPEEEVTYLEVKDKIKTLAKRKPSEGLPGDPDWYYHQRLEWCYQLKNNKDFNFNGGLSFSNTKDKLHCLNEDYQVERFGPECLSVATPKLSRTDLYKSMVTHPIGLCPSGFARSSFRIIELMALGRIVLLTDWKDYKYLYNPVQYVTVPDGTCIEERTQYALDNKEDLLEAAKENVAVFSDLTPQKMFEDFLAETK